MPNFYDKMFKPSSKKGVPIKDVEDYMIRQFFKTKKKSLTNQRVSKK